MPQSILSCFLTPTVENYVQIPTALYNKLEASSRTHMGITSYMKFFEYAAIKQIKAQQALINKMSNIIPEDAQDSFALIEDIYESHEGLTSLVEMNGNMVNDYCAITGQVTAQYILIQRDRWFTHSPN